MMKWRLEKSFSKPIIIIEIFIASRTMVLCTFSFLCFLTYQHRVKLVWFAQRNVLLKIILSKISSFFCIKYNEKKPKSCTFSREVKVPLNSGSSMISTTSRLFCGAVACSEFMNVLTSELSGDNVT